MHGDRSLWGFVFFECLSQSFDFCEELLDLESDFFADDFVSDFVSDFFSDFAGLLLSLLSVLFVSVAFFSASAPFL